MLWYINQKNELFSNGETVFSMPKFNCWYSHLKDIISYFSHEKTNTVCFHLHELSKIFKHYAKWKKPFTKDHMLYYFIHMKYSE